MRLDVSDMKASLIGAVELLLGRRIDLSATCVIASAVLAQQQPPQRLSA